MIRHLARHLARRPSRPHLYHRGPGGRRRGRLLALLAGGVALAAALAVAPVAVPPSGAADLGWHLTVEAPATVEEATVTVTGRAGVLLGQARTVRVRLVHRTSLPEACDVPEATGPVTGGAYAVELRPSCNGPYRAEVVASGTGLLGRAVSSGTPVTRDLVVADPGPAPGAPEARVDAEGITVTWAGPSDPDVVGWTLVPDGGTAQRHPTGTTRVIVPASPGHHGFRLVARRWGAEGPGGPEVASPPSAATPVRVSPTDLEPPPGPVGPDGPGSGSGAEGAGPAEPGHGPASADAGTPGGGGPDAVAAGVPRRRGPLARGGPDRAAGPTSGRPAPSPGEPGYGDELPYGDRADEAQPDPADEAEPAGDQVAAGSLTPRVVRTSERTSPGLVVPFGLAFVLGSAALWLWAYLRRARSSTALAGVGAPGTGPDTVDAHPWDGR